MDYESVCPVCFEIYKFPKLLPCKHTFCLCCLEDCLKGFTDKSILICPLCRERCYVPEKGLGEFPTNYFIPERKYSIICKECMNETISHVCYQCDTVLCHRCRKLHTHDSSKSHVTENDESSEDDAVIHLPFHIRWPLMHLHIKTEMIYKLCTQVIGNFPPAEEYGTRKRVRFMFPLKSGDVYVKLANIDILFKYNIHGTIVGSIHFRNSKLTATAGIANDNGSFLISFLETQDIYCYVPVEYGNYAGYTFAEMQNIYPLSMTELLNKNIAVSGIPHLCDRSCNENECEVEKNSNGAINIYNPEGELITKIEKDANEYTFRCPVMISANSKKETIAVCDHKLQKVIIIDYKGRVLGFYKGIENNAIPVLFRNDIFLPMAVCCTSSGDFIVSDPRKDYLLVLTPLGKFTGILRLDSLAHLLDISAICIDYKQNIWTGHFNLGTISVLTPDLYKNDLK